LAGALKEEGRSAGSSRDRRLQTTLVAGQVALCLALLVGANLMVRSFLELQRADAGFDESGLVSFRLFLPGDAYDPVAAKAAFFRQVAQRLRSLPGVEAATATSAIPADDGGAPVRVVGDGRPVAPGEEIGAQMIATQPALFDTLGIRLTDGRTFSEREAEDPRADVAIVNRRLAGRLWPGGDALGRRLGLVDGRGTTWLTVVGVAPEVHYEEFGEQTNQSQLHVYVPYARVGSRLMAVLVRGAQRADGLVQPVRRAMADTAPHAPVFRPAHDAGAAPGNDLVAAFLRQGDGRVRRSRAPHGLPRRVRRVELRGLAPHPRDRGAHGRRRHAAGRLVARAA
jgi:hypothetical protein